MELQYLLSLNVALLVSLATLLLSMGQQSPGKPLVVAAAALASVLLTDWSGRVRVNRTVAAVLAVAVVIFYFPSLISYQGEARILALADLLIYMQLIMLFQKKEFRVYGELIGLALLQVVVAAAFTQGFGFGLLLIVWMLVGLSALALLFLYGQWERYPPGADLPLPAAPPGSRWPLAAATSAFARDPGSRGHSGIVAELFARLGMIGLGTLLLTVLIFFTIPRLGHSAWPGLTHSNAHMVGFEDTVRLGEFGEVVENPEKVMRVYLFKAPAKRTAAGNHEQLEPYPQVAQLYLRGTMVTRYALNQWRRILPRLDPTDAPFDPGPLASTVVQRIAVEPMDRDELFCLWPFQLGSRERLFYEPQSQRLMRQHRMRGLGFTYELGTTALVGGVQVPWIPCEEYIDRALYLQMPALPRLSALAARWVAESKLARRQHVEIARMLENQLSCSDRFRYSLEGQDRDPALDAIEDFVSNHPLGHCEYFATALALMLRSQGIPSRVVLGYKCDEWDKVGRYYQVRQSQAHAWVEAYLEPRFLPAEFRHDEHWQQGGWLRLDATPADALAASRSAWQRNTEWVQSLWSDYVLEMDRKRQREAVFQPLFHSLMRGLQNLRDPSWWRKTFAAVAAALRISHWGGVGAWFLGVLLPLLLLGTLVAVMIWGIAGVTRRAWRRFRSRRSRRYAQRHRQVEFYGRLETLLGHRGLRRAAGQTPREFAVWAGLRLAQTCGRAEAADLPARVVEAFYRVRYGREPLDSPQVQAVEQALGDLAALTAAGRTGRNFPLPSRERAG